MDKVSVKLSATKSISFLLSETATDMFREGDLRCKVCGSPLSYEDWNRTKTCTSCQQFYQRSTDKMER